MDDLGTLLRFAHLVGVAVWPGGMIAVGAVVIPAVRAAPAASPRGRWSPGWRAGSPRGAAQAGC